MSFIVSVLQGMGLITQVREAKDEEPNPFLGAPRGAPTRRVSLDELSAASAEQSEDDELADSSLETNLTRQ